MHRQMVPMYVTQGGRRFRTKRVALRREAMERLMAKTDHDKVSYKQIGFGEYEEITSYSQETWEEFLRIADRYVSIMAKYF